MTAPTLQVQFDPSIARFGASRSQKRLEDDRLLVGKGLYSDDRVLPDQAWPGGPPVAARACRDQEH